MIQVRGPDGAIIQFPDGTPAGEMQMAMAHHYGAPDNAVTRANAEAQKRFANPDVAAASPVANGFLFNHAPEVAGAAMAAQTGLANLFGHGPGYGMKDAYQAGSAAQRQVLDRVAQNHPMASMGGNIAGVVGNPINMLAGEFIAGAPSVAQGIARSAGVGAVSGGVAGGVPGALTGGIVGAGLPMLGPVASALRNTASGVGYNAARAAGLVPAATVAARKLGSAAAKDAVDVAAAKAAWPGISDPSIADLTGENTRALIRNAGTAGPARQVLGQYRDQVAANLQDNQLGLTRQLTPNDARSAPTLSADIAAARTAASDANYNAFKPYQVPVGDDTNAALWGDAGTNALNYAKRIADAQRDPDAIAEIQALWNGDAKTVSAGTLDLIRRGLRDNASSAYAAGEGSIGSGLKGRAQDLATSLADVPGFQNAVDTHADLSNQIDAITHGLAGLKLGPSDFIGGLSPMNDAAKAASGVGMRDALLTALGAPTEGSVGIGNKISTSTNAGLKLGAQYGQPAADTYQSGLAAEGDRMSNANYMAPQTGSKTFSSAQDAGHGHFNIMGLVGGLLHGPDLTDAERMAIVQAGLGSDPGLLSLPQKSGSSLLGQWGPYMTAPAAQLTSGLLGQ